MTLIILVLDAPKDVNEKAMKTQQLDIIFLNMTLVSSLTYKEPEVIISSLIILKNTQQLKSTIILRSIRTGPGGNCQPQN